MNALISLFRNKASCTPSFCGTNLPPTLTTSDNRLSIVFRTDYSVGHDGFSATYVLLDADTGTNE